MRSETIRMNHVTLMDEGVMRLNDFNLYVFSGEILGLLLINDRGLSSLLRLLQHNIPLHYGAVYFKEKLVNSYSDPVYAINPTQIIERRSHLIGTLNIPENIFVLNRNFSGRMIQNKKLRSQTRLILEDFNVHIDPDLPIEELTTYQRMEIEIMRAVVSETSLVVLRDLVHLLTVEELDALHTLIRKCANMGISFIYICDQAETMEAVCDRIALYQDGAIRKIVQNELPKTDHPLKPYLQSFVESTPKASAPARSAPDPETASQAVLALRHCSDDVLSDVSLQAFRGHVTLFADQHMQVLQRIADVIMKRHALQAGDLQTYCNSGGDCNIYEILQNPTRTMLFYNLSVIDNLCFHLDERLSRLWKLERIRKNVKKELQDRLHGLLNAKNLHNLSKADLYNLVYSKCLIEKPDLVVLMCPVDNTDFDLRKNVMEYIRQLCENDMAVLILSTDYTLAAAPLVRHTYQMKQHLAQ